MGSRSSSSSSPVNTSSNRDSRLAVGDGGTGVSGDGSSLVLTNNTTDSRSFTDSSNHSDNRIFTDSSNHSDNRMFTDQTNNSDNRTFTDNSVNNSLDGGAIEAARKIAAAAIESANRSADAASAAAAQAGRDTAGVLDSALSFAKASDATNAQGFSSLLNTGLALFDANISSLDKERVAFKDLTIGTQQLTAQAYQTATAEKAGTIDNKTIVIMVAAAAVVAVVVFTKGK